MSKQDTTRTTRTTRMTSKTFGAAHADTATLDGAALTAWANDRRAAWDFMREQDELKNSAGFPEQIDGVWTVRYIDWGVA